MGSEQNMSYYTLDKNGQIYADYVKRLAEVLKNYNGQYDVSLAISILQSILTIVTESKLYRNKNIVDSLSYAEDIEKVKIINRNISANSVFGISSSSIIKNTFDFDRSLQIKDILKYIRNALSHPVDGKKGSIIPITGFYSIQNKDIEKIVFVNSPDQEKLKINLESFNQQKRKLGFPSTAVLINQIVTVDSKEYYRYIAIELNVSEIKQLVLGLSELFSEFVLNAENPEKLLKRLSEKFAA